MVRSPRDEFKPPSVRLSAVGLAGRFFMVSAIIGHDR
jgi:hypothetical protein